MSVRIEFNIEIKCVVFNTTEKKLVKNFVNTVQTFMTAHYKL